MYRLEFKLSLPLVFTSFPLVLMTLLFIAGAYELYQDLSSIHLSESLAKLEDDKVYKVDLQSSVALENQQIIAGLGIDNAEIYLLKVAREKTGLSGLFSKLKNKANNQNMKLALGASTSSKIISKPNYSAFLNKSEKLAMNESAIKKMIHGKKNLFKACYNKMLLKDALLSGTATITIYSQGRGNSQFKGIGRTKVISELKGCLNAQIKNIDLSSIDMTKAIRFSLNFSS